MNISFATLGFGKGAEKTETEKLGDLRTEAAKVTAMLRRQEISEQEAVLRLTELAEDRF